MIKVEHLRKSFGGVPVLKDVNAEIEKGEVISIIGPSGTGKSTFLRCLNRLESPDGGTITVDGVEITDPRCDIAAVRRKLGMVFQNFNLFGNLNVLENVMAAQCDILGTPKDAAREKALELLSRVGLADKASALPDELSGGQKQRVAIARALAMDPEILLFDEPTSALDPTMVGEVLEVIRALAKTGMTMLVVTHEMRFARNVSTRVFYMDEGSIYEDGSPADVFERPARAKTRAFVSRNLLSDTVEVMRRIALDDGKIDMFEAEMLLKALKPFADRGEGKSLELVQMLEEACADGIITAEESAGLSRALDGVKA